MKNMSDIVLALYMKHFKKWMHCPSCKEGKMIIDKKCNIWECRNCGYTIAIDVLENDYIYWFCDHCDSYLNTQDNFDLKSGEHICSQCGHTNSLLPEDMIGTCKDCGEFSPNLDDTICIDCQKESNKKVLKAIGIGAIGVGTAMVAIATIWNKQRRIPDDW